MTTRSYSDLSDSATTFDPEEQFDRDIDERMKGMSKEEAVARAIRDSDLAEGHCLADDTFVSFLPAARAAIAAADKWDAEQETQQMNKKTRCESCNLLRPCTDPECPNGGAISPGLDSAIQDELDHPPASIMEEGK